MSGHEEAVKKSYHSSVDTKNLSTVLTNKGFQTSVDPITDFI